MQEIYGYKNVVTEYELNQRLGRGRDADVLELELELRMPRSASAGDSGAIKLQLVRLAFTDRHHRNVYGHH